MKLLFTITISLACVICSAQVSPEAAAALQSFHDANKKNLAQHSCNMELINLQRNGIGRKIAGQIIRKATECIRNYPNAIPYTIRAEAYADTAAYEEAISDYNLAVKYQLDDIDSTKELMKWTGEAFRKSYEQSLKYLADLYNGRATVFMIKGDKAKAEADLKRALALLPNDYTLTTRLKNIDREIADKKKAAAIANPRTAEDFVIAGTEFGYRGKDKEALAALERAIQLDPRNAGAFIARGNLFAKTDSTGLKAIADYNKAISLDPSGGVAYLRRGYIYKQQRNWNAAIADFTKAISLSENSTHVYQARGSAHMGAGNIQEALTDFDKAVNSARDNKSALVSAQTGRGDAYAAMKKYDEAFKAYRAAIDAANGDYFAGTFLSETYVKRGILYVSQNMKKEAEADFREALKIWPKDERAKAELAKLISNSTGPQTAEEWAMYGRKQLQDQKFMEAIASLGKSIELNNRNGAVYALRGMAYGSAGNLPAFRSDFEKALQLMPREKAIFLMRGNFYMSKGMKAEAIGDFRSVLEIDPSNEKAKAGLKQLGY